MMFGNPTCTPCIQSKPIWIMECERSGVEFLYIDVHQNPELASELGIRMVPYVLIIDDGQIVDIINGATRPERIASALG